MALVLSHVQVEPLWQARQAGQTTAETSPDLGRSRVSVRLTTEGVVFPDGTFLDWETLAAIRTASTRCFVVADGQVRPIEAFSTETNRVYSLFPTRRAPTLLVSGIPMHRTKDIDPLEDTARKVRTIAPLRGRVLDTCTGLGYTAIAAARTADEVVTIELDPLVLAIARQNPWSQELFQDPRIVQQIGDTSDLVAEFPDQSFSRIIHDPPAFSLAGELYAGAFYRQLYRVLRWKGRLFHYVGDLTSPAGQRLARGVARRLQEAGFRRVIPRPEAFGFVAYKE